MDVPECPPGPWLVPQNHREYRELLERYCRSERGPEALEAINDRMDLQTETIERRQRPPSWMVLDLGDSTDLRQWSQVLRELQIDASAQASLKLLADDPSGWGPTR